MLQDVATMLKHFETSAAPAAGSTSKSLRLGLGTEIET